MLLGRSNEIFTNNSPQNSVSGGLSWSKIASATFGNNLAFLSQGQSKYQRNGRETVRPLSGYQRKNRRTWMFGDLVYASAEIGRKRRNGTRRCRCGERGPKYRERL